MGAVEHFITRISAVQDNHRDMRQKDMRQKRDELARWLGRTGMKRTRMIKTMALVAGCALPQIVAMPNVMAVSTPLKICLDWSQSGSRDTYTATIPASEASRHPVFQFWTNDGHGWKMVQNYSRKYTYQLPAAQSSDTLVAVYALSESQWHARDYKAAVYAARWANINASVSMSVPSAPNVGTSYTLRASSLFISRPVYQLWVQNPSGQWTAMGGYQKSSKFVWKPLAQGQYHFVIYARDSLLPATKSDEVSASFGTSTDQTATHVLFGSALPYVPAQGSKKLTVTLLNVAGNAVSQYSGPVTLSLSSSHAFSLKTATGTVSSGTVTVDASHGRATFTVVGDGTVGTTGTIKVTAPFASPTVTLKDVSDSSSAQVGYGIFTFAGQRISSAHPLLVTGSVTSSSTPLIPVSLKPVNVYGTPLNAEYTDKAVLSPYEVQSSPSMVTDYYLGHAVHFGGGNFPGEGTQYVMVSSGTQDLPLKFHPAAAGLQILSALPGKASVSAKITTLKSSSGTVLNATASSSGNATVTGVEPHTTYHVTAIPQLYGHSIAPGALVNFSLPNLTVTISSSGSRSTQSMVSVPTWQPTANDWTLTYISGSSANASDTLSLGNASESLTTNRY